MVKMTANTNERWSGLLSRGSFAACIIALAALALLPAQHMTRTFLGGHAEHLIAYLGTMIVMGVALHRRGRLDLQCLLLIIYAGVLEAAQAFVPGRHASLEDFAISASGAAVGALLVRVTCTLLPKSSPPR